MPAVEATPAPVAEYKPPEERGLRQKLAMVGAGILLLFVAFGVGTLINSDDTPKTAPEPVAERPVDDDIVRSGKRADTQLIPINEPIAQPITSAPAPIANANIPTEYQRHDATAVSSVEYQQLAAREQAERKKAMQQATVDPRSITGRAYAQGQMPVRRPAPAAAPAPSAAVDAAAEAKRTRPVAEYQPVPRIRLNESRTVRLDLMVGPDGRVQDVTIRGVVPGHTREILSAVQRWRYKPATVNGVPVSAPVTVDISFVANE